MEHYLVHDSEEETPQGKLTRWHVLRADTMEPVWPVERFLRFCFNKNLAVLTLRAYALKLGLYYDWLEETQRKWDAISLEDLAEFAFWYRTGGLHLKDLNAFTGDSTVQAVHTEATVNQALGAVYAFYDFHIVHGDVDKSRLEQLQISKGNRRVGFLRGITKEKSRSKRIWLKEPKTFPGCLSDDQIHTLIQACRTYRDRLIIYLLTETGMRAGELCSLSLDDLDFEHQRINIHRWDTPHGAYAKGPGRAGKRELMRSLHAPWLTEGELFQTLFTGYSEEEYPPEAEKYAHQGHLFLLVSLGDVHGKGRPLSPIRITHLMNELSARTGIDVHPHLFRHTAATRWLRAGTPIDVVQRRLGHKSAATTMSVYAHIIDEKAMAEAGVTLW